MHVYPGLLVKRKVLIKFVEALPEIWHLFMWFPVVMGTTHFTILLLHVDRPPCRCDSGLLYYSVLFAVPVRINTGSTETPLSVLSTTKITYQQLYSVIPFSGVSVYS